MRLPYGIIHDLGKEGFSNLLTITWGIIVTHQHASREIAAEVKKRISPSGQKKALKSLVRKTAASASPRLQETLPTTVADVRHAVLREHAVNLAGVLIARTGAAWTARLTAQAVRTAADEMAPILGWSEEQKAQEISKFSAYMKRYHNFNLIEAASAPQSNRMTAGLGRMGAKTS
jgi:glycerol-3-phosphate dehydrogenase